MGYDFTDRFSLYILLAYAKSDYVNDSRPAINFDSSPLAKNSGSDKTWSRGIGIKYSVIKDIDLNVEYESTSVNTRNAYPQSTRDNVRLYMIKVGLAYRF